MAALLHVLMDVLPDVPLPDVCPRCGNRFACGAAGSAPCACTTLTLSAERLAQLQAQYSSCLCMACLAALAEPGGHPVGTTAAVSGLQPRTAPS